jgi:hypothetical protein
LKDEAKRQKLEGGSKSKKKPKAKDPRLEKMGIDHGNRDPRGAEK